MLRSIVACVTLAAVGPVAAMAVTDDQVETAIGRMKAFLYSEQDESGSWDAGVAQEKAQATGRSALVLLALLSSGESEHHPRIVSGLKYLQSTSSDGTYAVALRSHVWAQLPEAYMVQLRQEANWLQRAHRESLFDYGSYRDQRVDHSVTQYGVLGLWEYAKRGGKVSPAFWEASIEHFLAAQNPDGGWGYSDGNAPSTGSMTTAGLTMLYVARQQLARDRPARPQLTAAIERGHQWLDERFDGGDNPGSGTNNLYYLYGLERVALAGGLKMLNGRDWYEAGAAYILSRQRPDGAIDGDVVDTAFALGFLARGRVPVWASKLAIPTLAWNHRPNDLYFLTAYLSDQFEREINWQVVSIDDPAEMWRSAPVTYLSTDQTIELTGKQKANLKRYIELGGTLMVNAEGLSKRTVLSFARIMKELFPDCPMRRLERDHVLYQVHHKLDPHATPVLAAVSAISSGARDVAVVFETDVGIAMQRDDPPGLGPAWSIMTNFFVLATDRRTLDNRLVAAYEKRQAGTAASSITVGRARYDGAWNVEPAALEPLGNHLFNRAAVELTIQEVPVSELGEARMGLVILTGIDAVTFSDSELAAIEKYVRGGGTLFVETIGGQGGFTRGMEGQLAARLSSTAVRLDGDSPIITGAGVAHAYDNTEVAYTRYTTTQMNAGNRPRFTAFYLDENRPAVILTSEDVSLALLNVRHWGVLGYDHDSARQLMTNLVLATSNHP